VDEDLKSHLTLTKAVNMAQNRPLWRLLSVSGAAQVVNDDVDGTSIA